MDGHEERVRKQNPFFPSNDLKEQKRKTITFRRTYVTKLRCGYKNV